MPGGKLPANVKHVLQDWFQAADKDPLRKQIEKTRHQVTLRIKELENADNQFSPGLAGIGSQKNMEREIMTLLNMLEKIAFRFSR